MTVWWLRPRSFPRSAGERIKTNRRDAIKLSRLHRAGELTQVWVPDPAHEAMRDLVQALQALRGMALVSAATVVAELGDLTRFANPRQLMAYLGLVPSEHSSGDRRRQGGITKAGNNTARRMLVEAARSYRFPPRVSRNCCFGKRAWPSRSARPPGRQRSGSAAATADWPTRANQRMW